MHFFSFRLLRIFTSLDYRFSGYFHRCWIFSVYSDFIFLFTNSECICDWTLINPRLFCWPSRFRFFVFRKFPDNKVLSRKLLSFVYICETEERGLRYDLSLSHLKVAIIVFWSCIANAKKKAADFSGAKNCSKYGILVLFVSFWKKKYPLLSYMFNWR